MSNSTNITIGQLTDLQRALIILPVMDKYMLIILYILGVVGSLLNISTLLQKQFQKNPCSLYFLSASVTDFFIMNGVLMMDAMRYFDAILYAYMNLTTIWCKLGKYFVFILPCLSSTFITFASIDRFCTSSPSQQFRNLSRLKVSRILIFSVLLVWILFSLRIIILYDIMPPSPTKSDRCRGPSDTFLLLLIIDGYLFSLFNGAIVPIFLAIFGILIYRNVQLSRRRTAPMPDTNSNRPVVVSRNPPITRRNLHLITMLLVQSSLTIFLNIPYMIIYLNSFYNNLPTNQLLLLIYAIFAYIGRWFWFSNYVKTFYLNSLSSQVFRDALKQQLRRVRYRVRNRILPWTST